MLWQQPTGLTETLQKPGRIKEAVGLVFLTLFLNKYSEKSVSYREEVELRYTCESSRVQSDKRARGRFGCCVVLGTPTGAISYSTARAHGCPWNVLGVPYRVYRTVWHSHFSRGSHSRSGIFLRMTADVPWVRTCVLRALRGGAGDKAWVGWGLLLKVPAKSGLPRNGSFHGRLGETCRLGAGCPSWFWLWWTQSKEKSYSFGYTQAEANTGLFWRNTL